MGVSEAIDLVLDYILHSEMGGKYNPGDSWVQCHELLTELKEKAIEEDHRGLDTTHLLENCSLSG